MTCNGKTVAIIIPVYQSELSRMELISLTQCRRILNHYQQIIIAPQSLALEENCILQNKIERFQDFYFRGIEGYNKLLLSEEFYERFIEFEYILIYQLDAYVFSDRLKFFCDLQYDYIGAPWLDGQVLSVPPYGVVAFVGNGGFSLRRTKSFLRFLREMCLDENHCKIHEDFIFSVYGQGCLRIAPVKIALQFSFETKVRECFQMNNNCMPFGCHAWEKYDFEFWRPYFEEDGYDIKDYDFTRLDALKEYVSNRYLVADSVQIHESINRLLPCYQKGIYIWGAGIRGQRCRELLDRAGISVIAYIDNDKGKNGMNINGITVKSCIELFGTDMNVWNIIYPVIITMRQGYEEVEDYLQARGLKKGVNYVLFHDLADDLSKQVSILE